MPQSPGGDAPPDIADDVASSERQTLLEGCEAPGPVVGAAPPGGSGQPRSPVAAPAAAALLLKSAASADVPVCRICLEDDAPANLLAPCHCTGTQKWAHRPCLQRWIDEKRSPSCDVCGHAYSGGFTVPSSPPPPPALAEGAPLPQLTRAEREALRHILSRLVPPGGDADVVIRGDGPGGGARVLHVFEEEAPPELERAQACMGCVIYLLIVPLTMLYNSYTDDGLLMAGMYAYLTWLLGLVVWWLVISAVLWFFGDDEPPPPAVALPAGDVEAGVVAAGG